MSNSGQAAKPQDPAIPPKAGCTANSLPGFKAERFETVTFFPAGKWSAVRKVERCAYCAISYYIAYFAGFQAGFFIA